MEQFNQPTPIITERNQAETDASAERKRDLLSNEIDYTAQVLDEFAVPDFQTKSNENFQLNDSTFESGKLNCQYESGQLQAAKIDLKHRGEGNDATLDYDQQRDSWFMSSNDIELPMLVTNLDVMKSILRPHGWTDQMKSEETTHATLDDLLDLFETKSQNYVDVKTYSSIATDDEFYVDSMGRTNTSLTVSASRNPHKNYNSLHVQHSTTDMSDPANETTTVDKEYKLTTGKNNISYSENDMTQEEAGQALAELKNDKNFASLGLEQL